MSEQLPPPLKPSEKAGLQGLMLEKLAHMKQIASETGKSTDAAQKETKRQLKQITRENKLTKSGPED